MNSPSRKVLSLSGARIDAHPRTKKVVQVMQQTAYIAPDPTAEELDELYATLSTMTLRQREMHLRAVGLRYGLVASEDDEVAADERADAIDIDSQDDEDGDDNGTVYKHVLATDYYAAGELDDLCANVAHDDGQSEGGGEFETAKYREALSELAVAVHTALPKSTRKWKGEAPGGTKANDQAVAAGINLAVRHVQQKRTLKTAADIASDAKVRYQTLLEIKDEALEQIQRLGIAGVLRGAD